MSARIALLTGAALIGLIAYGLAQPLPFVPLFVPIGAHASAGAFAESQGAPGLTQRVLLEREGRAVALFLSDEAASMDESQIVYMRRYPTGGWFGGAGGRGSGPRAERPPIPIGLMRTEGASRTDGSFDAYIAVGGRAAPVVARVEVTLASGTRESALVNSGGYLWFRGVSLLDDQSRSTPPTFPSDLNPVEVRAYDTAGVELYKQQVASR
jgi:hypothetical protein